MRRDIADSFWGRAILPPGRGGGPKRARRQGNLAAKDAASYTFDFGNRLRLGTGPGGSEGYRYDGHGRRALAWVPAGATLSFYAFNGQLLYQHSTPKARALDHIYLAGSLVAIREAPFAGGSVVKYQHTDALGSPVAISNAAGTVTERTNYDPYGGAINKTVDGVGYTGHVMDPVTGLTYMQQRYYDPTVGRFLSVDPLETNRQTAELFNRYLYANGNPYRYVDPDGRLFQKILWDIFGVKSDPKSPHAPIPGADRGDKEFLKVVAIGPAVALSVHTGGRSLNFILKTEAGKAATFAVLSKVSQLAGHPHAKAVGVVHQQVAKMIVKAKQGSEMERAVRVATKELQK